MIDFDKPYGEHFGGSGPARYTQDGTDYNAAGYELDADGTVIEKPNVFVPVAEIQQADIDQMAAARDKVETPKHETSSGDVFRDILVEPPHDLEQQVASAQTSAKVNPAPADYTALKADIGEEAYSALSKEDKRAGALQKRAERLN